MTVPGDGVLDQSNVPSVVVIPFNHEGIQVIEIGTCAFQGISSIREVIIKAKIQQISRRAFYQCENLEKINIPASVFFMGSSSIDTRLIEQNTPSDGTLSVYFEPFSQLKYILNAGISNKKRIILYICEVFSPEITTYFLGGANIIIVYSPTSFIFCGYQTTLGPCVQSFFCHFKSFPSSLSASILLIYISLIFSTPY